MVDMSDCMKIIVKENGNVVSETPIADPFHTTRVEVDQRMSWISFADWWQWIRMPFCGFQTSIIVKVQAETKAIRHWFSTPRNE